MVAYIREMAVTRKGWLTDETFKRGVALAQSVPGATAMQVAAYVGLTARGIPGALCTFTGFGLPAFILMVALAFLYRAGQDLPWVHSVFNGLQVIVVALMANASLTFGRGNLKGYADGAVAAIAASLFWFGLSPFYVIMGAAIAGVAVMKTDSRGGSATEAHRSVPTVQIGLLLLIVLCGIAFLFMVHPGILSLSLLMIKVDLFAFGGGFAAIPLMLQEVVNVRGWMDSKTFMDGIALGQITPGPIVITSTFVGALLYGVPGAIAATMAIFTPSFLFVVIGAGVFDRLKRSPSFGKAVKGILASFVGLLLYVTIHFAVAVPWGPVRIIVGLVAFAALLKKIDVLYIVPAAALLSVLFL